MPNPTSIRVLFSLYEAEPQQIPVSSLPEASTLVERLSRSFHSSGHARIAVEQNGTTIFTRTRTLFGTITEGTLDLAS